MKFLIALLVLSSFSASAFECKAKKLTLKESTDPKQMLAKLSNQEVFEGLVHELTQKELPKSPGNAKLFSEHLISSEKAENQNSLIRLLVYTSDLKTETPRTLDLKELCEVVQKVNELPAK